MDMSQLRRTLFLVLAVITIGIAPAMASNHLKGDSKTDKKAAPKTGPDAPPSVTTTAPVKVEITTFTQLHDGDTVNFTATVVNTGSATVARVPWAIRDVKGNQNLAEGTQENLRPGGTFDMTARWTKVKVTKTESFFFEAYVDPTGKVLKNTALIEKQIKKATVVIMYVAPFNPAKPGF
jgi:hypothetical protein